MTLRALLSYLMTAILIATSIVLATAATSHAAPGSHRPVTWNMQGASSSSDSKWTTTVARLATGRNNNFAHDVVALQEAGPRNALPGTVVRNGNITVNGRQATYEYEVRRWNLGTSTRPQYRYITWLNTDPTGNRNNVAIVTESDPGVAPIAVPARQANGTAWGMRPALGVQLADGSWFYSFHASSNGDNRSNDAENMLYQIAARGGQWAVLGDFNRRPENLPNLPAGSQIYTSGQGTQQGGGELDYMVSNDRAGMTGWTGRRINGAGSDHYAVEFAFRASANKDVISTIDRPDRCLTIPGDSTFAVMARCDETGTPVRRDGMFEPYLTSGPACLRGGYVGSIGVTWMGSCLEMNSHEVKWDFPEDGRIVLRSTGWCLDTSSKWGTEEEGFEARTYQCDTNTLPANQNFVRTYYYPYNVDPRPGVGPVTGTEDAETGGSATPPPGDSCPHPENPTFPSCRHISKRSIADVPIPDQTTAESPLQVHGQSGYAPTNLAVGVDIKHTHRGNLVLSLVAPNGSVYPLEDIADSDSNDHVFKSYTVNASNQIANGTWKLRVRDIASGNVGTIDAWNLTFPNGTADTATTPPILDHHENLSHAITSSNSGSAPTNLGVTVQLTHPRRGDLVIRLYGPSGRSYLLEDFTDSDTTANVSKNYTVNVSSETGSGLWRLSVTDIRTGNTGTIDAWALGFPRPSPF
ncbi:proprotein convertase P-domain-containing protein [Streptomyces sp. NPDC056254]|uniref:proprotein convertase P-domain-containing protein n=1 Tax=Streptomyces sp. NPDC056254 TaxID=3345763 RepID=UPI0035DBD8E4